MTRSILALLFALVLAIPAGAADSASPPDTTAAKAFVESMVQRGIDMLSDSSLSLEEKEATFSTLLNDNFDMKTIARFALGPHWRTATPAQQAEYVPLFQAMIVRHYSTQFKDYEGQKVAIGEAQAQDNSGDIIVASILPLKARKSNVAIDWRVRYKNGQYKIVDVMVEGVSMALTHQADFASVIESGGGDVEVLLNHLRTKAKD